MIPDNGIMYYGIFYIYIFFKIYFHFLFRAAVSAFKPFCPAHIVFRNINIYSLSLLYILSNK